MADDHTLVTTALTEMLGIYSVRTITVQNAAETLEKAQLLQPALLLIDMQLPSIAGQELLVALRSMAHLQTTPIIAMSALDWPTQAAHFWQPAPRATFVNPSGQNSCMNLFRNFYNM